MRFEEDWGTVRDCWERAKYTKDTPDQITPYHITSQHTTMQHTTPQYTTPQYTIPHHNTLYHTTIHYTTPQYSTPHHNTVQCNTQHQTNMFRDRYFSLIAVYHRCRICCQLVAWCTLFMRPQATLPLSAASDPELEREMQHNKVVLLSLSACTVLYCTVLYWALL
jgi:hypothetical protein